MIYPWQQSQWQHISQQIESNRLPHALLLTGNRGLGKADFAMALASTVLCLNPEKQQACEQCKSCLLLKAGTHPDLHRLTPKPPVNSKSQNPVLSIKIEDVRSLCQQLNQTSQYGSYRVAVLEHAETLTIPAANSLLKTLEEPGNNVLIILITSRPGSIPATIRSRCQTLRFSPPDSSLSQHWLEKKTENTYSPEQCQQVLNRAYGAPLTALGLLEENEQYQAISAAMTARLTDKNTLVHATKLTRFNKVAVLEMMLTWVADLCHLIACGSHTDIINEGERKPLVALASVISPQQLFQFQDQLIFQLSHQSIAVNEQLLWENLLLSWNSL